MSQEILTTRNTVPVSGYRSARWQRDVGEANRLSDAGQKLPWRLWSAHIAQMTGQYCHKFSITKTHYGEAYVDDRLVYFTVTEVADSRNVWFALLGKDKMLQAILLLDSEGARETALEAAGGCFHTEPQPVREKVLQLVAGFEMPPEKLNSTASRYQQDPVQPSPMTEPPEVFQAEMTRLRLVRGGQSPDLSSEGLLSKFYEG